MHSTPAPHFYAGFRPWSNITPPVLKPGETIEGRAAKFAGVGHGVQYSGPPPVETLRDATNSSHTMSTVEAKDYKVPDRRGVSALWTGEDPLKRSKPFCGKTMHSESFKPPPSVGFQKAAKPEWLTSSSAVESRVSGNPVRSTYQKDMGMAGQVPGERPYLYKTGMASTTMDLYGGTAKATHHVPGYQGHIPVNQRHPLIVKHSDAVETRDPHTNLRLYHRHNMPGYTGHHAMHPSNDYGQRLSGTHPSTTSGAAALGMYV